MKSIKLILSSSIILFILLTMSGCENTSVSGSVSYGMGMGHGYPMYYGHGGHRQRGQGFGAQALSHHPRTQARAAGQGRHACPRGQDHYLRHRWIFTQDLQRHEGHEV